VECLQKEKAALRTARETATDERQVVRIGTVMYESNTSRTNERTDADKLSDGQGTRRGVWVGEERERRKRETSRLAVKLAGYQSD